MLFYTTFIIKQYFQLFGEMVKKNHEDHEMSFIFSELCTHVDRLLKKKVTMCLWEQLCVHICMIFLFYANLQFYVGSCHGSTRK